MSSNERVKALTARELRGYRSVVESAERGMLEAVLKAEGSMSQREIAEHTGWSQAKVSRIIRAERARRADA